LELLSLPPALHSGGTGREKNESSKGDWNLYSIVKEHNQFKPRGKRMNPRKGIGTCEAIKVATCQLSEREKNESSKGDWNIFTLANLKFYFYREGKE